jgi:pyridoxal phosphate enzyme (YggS family)
MNVKTNLAKTKDQIKIAEQQYGKPVGSVELLAVSKHQPLTRLQQAVNAGQYLFAESYLQEALPKIHALAKQKIEWHFIGNIQSNKTQAIATHFSWVHSVDCLNIAERLSRQRPATFAPLNICIQVNIDDEAQKAGASINELTSLATAISKLPNLKLRGLMAIPKPRQDFIEQRAVFKKLRLAFEQLKQQGFALDTLSMGMSDDFVAAIAEGATIVRIGTAIFGKRFK